MTMRSLLEQTPSVYENLNRPYPLSDYPSDRVLLENNMMVVERKISDIPTCPQTCVPPWRSTARTVC